jgi:hypothetical protein
MRAIWQRDEKVLPLGVWACKKHPAEVVRTMVQIGVYSSMSLLLSFLNQGMPRYQFGVHRCSWCETLQIVIFLNALAASAGRDVQEPMHNGPSLYHEAVDRRIWMQQRTRVRLSDLHMNVRLT